MIRLAVRCSAELAEQVLVELCELAPSGVEETAGEGWIEYAIYGPPGELPELPELEAAAGEGLVSISTSEVADDWADRWRDFHRPVRVGERLVVLPSWERVPEERAEIEIVIDPGRAFGTGSHATTSLCLELLVELADRGGRASVADLGTGSGVLAIAAAKLGLGPVWTCDQERAAVEAARQNAERNGVGIEVERRDLRERTAQPAEIWLANLTAPILAVVGERIPPPGDGGPDEMIVSGLLREEVARVERGFEPAGFATVEARCKGGWAALLLRR